VVAAAVEAGEQLLRGSELRVSLRGRLPEYMIPSAIVVLDELPLTPNGKVDRKALRAMKWEDEARAFDPLETPTEEILAEFWRDMLGVERVGAKDNFFDLGGHSITATRLISRVRAAFGIDLSLRTLFVSPTVRELAEAIEEAALEQSSAENVDELLNMLESLGNDETTEIPALNRGARDDR
jgi:acyl carrier protein